MSEPDSYTSHNFSAVNEQIREIAAREKARTTAYRLESYRTAFMYAGATVLIIGLLALLLSWSYRLINAPYPEEVITVVKPEIIEKEVIKVVQVPVEKSVYDQTSTSYQGPQDSSSLQSNQSSSGQTAIVTNYHTFKTVDADEFSSSGFTSVVTGWRYADSNNDYPEYQFCYFNIRSGGKATTTRVNLADIEGAEFNSLIDSSLAREVSISQATLRRAEKKCEWAGS